MPGYYTNTAGVKMRQAGHFDLIHEYSPYNACPLQIMLIKESTMNEKVIELLNQARQRELHAIMQYMIQHYELADAGYKKLAGRLKQVAIQEMRHAEDLAERILFLKGCPTTKPDAEVAKGLTIPDILKTDVAIEESAVKMYNESAKICAAENDNVSKELFEKLLADEEEHVDEFQKTLDHVEQLGDSYLATLLE